MFVVHKQEGTVTFVLALSSMIYSLVFIMAMYLLPWSNKTSVLCCVQLLPYCYWLFSGQLCVKFPARDNKVYLVSKWKHKAHCQRLILETDYVLKSGQFNPTPSKYKVESHTSEESVRTFVHTPSDSHTVHSNQDTPLTDT